MPNWSKNLAHEELLTRLFNWTTLPENTVTTNKNVVNNQNLFCQNHAWKKTNIWFLGFGFQEQAKT